MREWIPKVAEFALAVARGQRDAFASLAQAACEAGASRDALLMAVEVGRRLGGPAEPTVALAYGAVDEALSAERQRRTVTA